MSSIWVFDSPHKTELLNFFITQGYAPYYDAKHRYDQGWLDRVEPNRMYDKFEEYEECVTAPSVLIVGNFTGQEWDIIKDWLNGVIEHQQVLLPPFKLTQGNDIAPLVSIAPEFTPVKGEYGFSLELLENDIMLYEVTRPGTKLPFCVVVHDWAKKGHEYFFSDIYGSNSWDANRRECRFDYLFLQNVWHHLKMPGEFTMNVVKKRVDGCYPDRLLEGVAPEGEPVVYRNTINQVKGILARKWGVY